MQERKVDSSLDVILFGEHIAPKMGLNVSFVGGRTD